MELRLSHNGIIVGYYQSSANSNKQVVFCQGLPQYVTPHHEFVQKLLALGYNVFAPRYAGTWESDGDFGPVSAAETIGHTIDLVTGGRATETYSNKEISWNTEEIALIGFSFGAAPALANASKVHKTILLMPFVHPQAKDTSSDQMLDTLDFVNRGYKNAYRSSLSPTEFLAQYKELDYTGAESVKDTVLGVRGQLDRSISDTQYDFLSKYAAGYRSYEVKHTANLTQEMYNEILN